MIKSKKIKSILMIFVALIAVIFGFATIDLSAKTKDSSADTSFGLYLQGASEYTTTKTGAVSMSLKLNNPAKEPIYGVECKIYYDANCMTLTSGTTSLRNWSGSAKYNEKNGYIKIAFSGGTSDDQFTDALITVATLNFTIKTPNAQTYPFTFQDISVSGIDPSVGAIEHAVTGQDFNLTFRAPRSDASLKSVVSVKANGSEVGTYNAGTRTYTATVPFKTTSVSISATPNDSSATISGTGNWALQPNKLNTRTITVTAEDKITTQTYTVNITREAGKTDSSIGSLSLKDSSNKEIALTKDDKTYSASIDSTNMAGLKLSATANDTDATVTINGQNPTNYALNLAMGENTFTVKVTAEDGSSTEYSVVITVNYIKSSDVSLKSLSVKANGNEVGSLNEATKTYTANVENSVASVEVDLQANHEKAKVEGNGTWNLEVGENTKTITITAEDGVSISSYTIVITRADKQPVEPDNPDDPEKPGNLAIKSLTTSDGRVTILSNGNYVIQFPEGTTKLNLNIVANNSEATVEIYAMSAYSQTPINQTPYLPGHDFPISEEVTRLKITIKTESEQKSFEVALLSYPLDEVNFIKFGGDIDLTISKYDFLDLSSSNMLTTIKTSKDKISFHLDFAGDISVNAVYGTDDVGEIRVLTNGYTRVVFNSNKIEENGNSIVLQITDNVSGNSRVYVIKVVKNESNIPLILTISFGALLLFALILVIAMLVKLKKDKKQHEEAQKQEQPKKSR